MHSSDELTCKEFVELVTEYLEGALPDETRARFDTHLGKCKGCTNYLTQMRFTISTTGTLTEETIPAGAREEMLALFRDWKKG